MTKADETREVMKETSNGQFPEGLEQPHPMANLTIRGAVTLEDGEFPVAGVTVVAFMPFYEASF